jgi:hypothetical protein
MSSPSRPAWFDHPNDIDEKCEPWSWLCSSLRWQVSLSLMPALVDPMSAPPLVSNIPNLLFFRNLVPFLTPKKEEVKLNICMCHYLFIYLLQQIWREKNCDLNDSKNSPNLWQYRFICSCNFYPLLFYNTPAFVNFDFVVKVTAARVSVLNQALGHKDVLASRGIASRIPYISTRCSWAVSLIPRPLYPSWKSPRFPLNRRLDVF